MITGSPSCCGAGVNPHNEGTQEADHDENFSQWLPAQMVGRKWHSRCLQEGRTCEAGLPLPKTDPGFLTAQFLHFNAYFVLDRNKVGSDCVASMTRAETARPASSQVSGHALRSPRQPGPVHMLLFPSPLLARVTVRSSACRHTNVVSRLRRR